MLDKLTTIFLGSKNDIDIMKDFEDMTSEEKEEILEDLRNLPDESIDPIDAFLRSFNELSQNWFSALREVDCMYSKSNIESHINNIEKKSESH